FYLDPETNIWSMLPWDIDLTWANNMYGNGEDPFKNQGAIFSNPELLLEYKNRLREIEDLLYNPDQMYPLLDELADIIDPPGAEHSIADADRAMWDYNPIMTSSYVNSSKAGAGRFYQAAATKDFRGMVQLMKDYVVSSNREFATDTTDPYLPDTPVVSYVGPAGYPINRLAFTTTPFSDASGTFAAMKWRIAEVTDPSAPAYDPDKPRKFEITPTWESDELTTFNDSVTIPPEKLKPGHAYRVRVRMKDSTGRWSHWSAPVQFIAGEADESELTRSLRVTEIMYNPAPPPPGGAYDNDEFEFIELKNTGCQVLDISGVSFTNGIEFSFAGSGVSTLQPGQHVLVVKNLAAFESRYDTTGMLIAGQFTSGKLSNAGEKIELVDAVDGSIQEFSYDDGWYGQTDGEGYSLCVLDEHAPPGEWDHKRNWQASGFTGGNPGQDNDAPAPGSVVISEVLAHSDVAPNDWIELHNTTDADIDVADWYLSDSGGDLMKYRIPAGRTGGTVIPAGGYLVLSQDDDFGGAFALSELGDDVYLSSGSAGRLGGYREHVDFDASPNGQTFGLYTKSTGGTDFTLMNSPTMGSANSLPYVGDIVINEIMYHPPGDGLEYIELYNRTDSSAPLYDPANPADLWRIAGGVSYTFPAGAAIDAHQYALVVEGDPDTFRSRYGVPADVAVYGPLSGSLGNAGESVRLERPDRPEAGGFVPYVLEDHVRYNDKGSWPRQADGLGSSLCRLDPAAYGNDSANWAPSTTGGTPGGPNVIFDTTPPTTPSDVQADVVAQNRIDLTWTPAVDDESGVAFYTVYRDDTAIGTSAGTSYADEAVQPGVFYSYHVTASNNDGYESQPSCDVQAGLLTIDSVTVLDETTLRVAFPQTVTAQSAEVPSNYAVDGQAVTAAVLAADGRAVYLTTAQQMAEGGSYTLTAGGVAAGSGLVLPPGTTYPFQYVGWQGGDIGNVGFRGSDSLQDGTWTITAAGANIWGTADAFHFAYRMLFGDGQITARVVSIDHTHDWAKAGVMFRQSLDAGSANAFIYLTPAAGVSYQGRPADGEDTYYTQQAGVEPPYWLRLRRQGDTFTAYSSADGRNWTLVETDTFYVDAVSYIGLALTSHDNLQVCTAVFDNVAISKDITSPTADVADVAPDPRNTAVDS
ncbi:MAG: lamin tail domain-containing protein, partial [Planctomycetes bacterium]|nr:lamin tail domain-containing protein [Planctomycetota bacterium]